MKQNYFENRKKKFDIDIKNKFIKQIPKNALVELTNACNHACIFCYNPEMKRSISTIDNNVFKSFILKGVSEGLEEVGLYSTGEPFMTKNLHEFIKISKDNGLKRVYITSNGALANLSRVKKALEAGLDSIKFSINAGSKETYKIIHGHDDFDKVIKNLQDIYHYKKDNKIKLQLLCSFVFTDLTKKEIISFKKKYQKYFDEEIRFVKAANQGGHTKDRSEILTNKMEHEINNHKDLNLEKEFKPCGMLWDRLHLTSEGNLTACCVDYENDLVYKKFSEKEKIIDQFNSEKITNLRDKHLKNDLKNTICHNCIYNENSKYSKIDDKIVASSKQTNNSESNKIKLLKSRINQFVKKVQ
jgi:MoaA/NifB/PqqE/SkfB family radical SAM enzyme